ncbi:MAG: class I SAM-dependent methyltransferase [Pseudomonadales bacterium]|jgi:ubiquinone/menaquinone biosynthesis C-methylase UbiE|nr:class I SAM-dependent methyltransferase [Pseudomonadales bacterium]
MDLSGFENRVCSEMELLKQLPLDGSTILELGCGRADITRFIASTGSNRKVIATEVDTIQHNKNLLIDDLSNVTFLEAGAEKIPVDDSSVDAVFMFKSLHHVPLELMDTAFDEIRRVLNPGGFAYISEPVFAGKFNEVLRIFHDEEIVRDAAYKAIKKTIENRNLSLVDEIFFSTPVVFESFEFFRDKVVNVTHTDHHLTPELINKVKDQFMLSMDDDGARFEMPIRVNLLEKI